MKKIILIMFFSLTLFGNTKPCMLDVYFGNGVWNDKASTIISMDALKIHMQTNSSARFDRADEGITYSFKYAHNETYGTINDLIETHWQLYENGQISKGYFTFAAAALSRIDNSDITVNEFTQKINNIIAQYNLDSVTMLNNYRTNSFNKNNNVLLVAHSQGNLFGNAIYNMLSDDEKQKFKMVSVATPANSVAGAGNYTTLHGDLVIKAIPNALTSNAFGFGHTFVASYLNNPYYQSAQNIILNIQNAAEGLDQNNCKSYLYYRWIGYECPNNQDKELELVVDIYGTFALNFQTREDYVVSDIRQRVALENGSCPLTEYDYKASIPSYDKDGCYAYRITDTSPASIDLDLVFSTQYQNNYTCATYNMSSEVLDKLKGMKEK